MGASSGALQRLEQAQRALLRTSEDGDGESRNDDRDGGALVSHAAQYLRSLAVVGLHGHLLPGLDDGPGTLDDSLALAGAMVAQGTRTVAATPHVSSRFTAWTSRCGRVRRWSSHVPAISLTATWAP